MSNEKIKGALTEWRDKELSDAEYDLGMVYQKRDDTITAWAFHGGYTAGQADGRAEIQTENESANQLRLYSLPWMDANMYLPDYDKTPVSERKWLVCTQSRDYHVTSTHPKNWKYNLVILWMPIPPLPKPVNAGGEGKP